ncbi:unnamed protein product [Bemisia tabaci]|uniref:Ribosomal RNA-processing protein 8 n=1 Tax=Bemisia tabaci TaxID=7038 RepID=A0A9P0F7H8_BEMTA|nr:unnamed protein product [Bemisia tabaci]
MRAESKSKKMKHNKNKMSNKKHVMKKKKPVTKPNIIQKNAKRKKKNKKRGGLEIPLCTQMGINVIDKEPPKFVDKKEKIKKPFPTLAERMIMKLKAARFRYINEQLYTQSGEDAVDHFSQNPEDFEAYHEGFQHQVSKWPINPLDSIVKSIKKMLQRKELPPKCSIADFGCGDAKLADALTDLKVHSFDLVAVNSKVTACNMSHVPLPSESVDVAVFCLSLMGTDLTSYIKEANRVLKPKGIMKIAEVESRFDKVSDFIENVERCGFLCTKRDSTKRLFVFLDFEKAASLSKNQKRKLPELTLKPCLYKKR